MESPRIEFYRQRTFSEKMNVTFEFIRENWKPILKYSFYLLMPVCLAYSLAMNSFLDLYMGFIKNAPTGNPFDSAVYSIFIYYGVLALCGIIGMAITSGLIFAMMQTYATRENRLRDVTLNDFKDILIKNIWKYVRLTLIFFAAYLVLAFLAVALVFVSAYTLLLTIPAILVLIALFVLLLMVLPVYVFEQNISLSDAFIKAWNFGIATFWGMLGLMIVVSIISSVVQQITALPWNLVVAIGYIFSMASESITNQSVIYKFMVFMFGLIQSFGMFLSMTICFIGIAFQYFHAREKVEGITIESNISNFNEL